MSSRKRLSNHKSSFTSLNRFSKRQRGIAGEHLYARLCEAEDKGLEEMEIKISDKADRSNIIYTYTIYTLYIIYTYSSHRDYWKLHDLKHNLQSQNFTSWQLGREILHRYASPSIQTTLQQPYEIIPRPQILEQDGFIKLRLRIKERRKGFYSKLVNFKTRERIWKWSKAM